MNERNLSEKYVKELLSLKKEGLATCVTDYTKEQIAYRLNRIDQLDPKLQYKGHTIIEHREGENLIGFVSYTVKNEQGIIESLYVKPENHRQNIGSTLLKKAEDEMIRVNPGVNEIMIESTVTAVPFYNEHGYDFKESIKSRSGFDISVLVKSL